MQQFTPMERDHSAAWNEWIQKLRVKDNATFIKLMQGELAVLDVDEADVPTPTRYVYIVNLGRVEKEGMPMVPIENGTEAISAWKKNIIQSVALSAGASGLDQLLDHVKAVYPNSYQTILNFRREGPSGHTTESYDKVYDHMKPGAFVCFCFVDDNSDPTYQNFRLVDFYYFLQPSGVNGLTYEPGQTLNLRTELPVRRGRSPVRRKSPSPPRRTPSPSPSPPGSPFASPPASPGAARRLAATPSLMVQEILLKNAATVGGFDFDDFMKAALAGAITQIERATVEFKKTIQEERKHRTDAEDAYNRLVVLYKDVQAKEAQANKQTKTLQKSEAEAQTKVRDLLNQLGQLNLTGIHKEELEELIAVRGAERDAALAASVAIQERLDTANVNLGIKNAQLLTLEQELRDEKADCQKTRENATRVQQELDTLKTNQALVSVVPGSGGADLLNQLSLDLALVRERLDAAEVENKKLQSERTALSYNVDRLTEDRVKCDADRDAARTAKQQAEQNAAACLNNTEVQRALVAQREVEIANLSVQLAAGLEALEQLQSRFEVQFTENTAREETAKKTILDSNAVYEARIASCREEQKQADIQRSQSEREVERQRTARKAAEDELAVQKQQTKKAEDDKIRLKVDIEVLKQTVINLEASVARFREELGGQSEDIQTLLEQRTPGGGGPENIQELIGGTTSTSTTTSSTPSSTPNLPSGPTPSVPRTRLQERTALSTRVEGGGFTPEPTPPSTPIGTTYTSLIPGAGFEAPYVAAPEDQIEEQKAFTLLSWTVKDKDIPPVNWIPPLQLSTTVNNVTTQLDGGIRSFASSGRSGDKYTHTTKGPNSILTSEETKALNAILVIGISENDLPFSGAITTQDALLRYLQQAESSISSTKWDALSIVFNTITPLRWTAVEKKRTEKEYKAMAKAALQLLLALPPFFSSQMVKPTDRKEDRVIKQRNLLWFLGMKLLLSAVTDALDKWGETTARDVASVKGTDLHDLTNVFYYYVSSTDDLGVIKDLLLQPVLTTTESNNLRTAQKTIARIGLNAAILSNMLHANLIAATWLKIIDTSNQNQYTSIARMVTVHLNTPLANYLEAIGAVIAVRAYRTTGGVRGPVIRLQLDIVKVLERTTMQVAESALVDVNRLVKSNQIREASGNVGFFTRIASALPMSFHANITSVMSQLPVNPVNNGIRQQLSAAAANIRPREPTTQSFISTTAPAGTGNMTVDSGITPFLL